MFFVFFWLRTALKDPPEGLFSTGPVGPFFNPFLGTPRMQGLCSNSALFWAPKKAGVRQPQVWSVCSGEQGRCVGACCQPRCNRVSVVHCYYCDCTRILELVV